MRSIRGAGGRMTSASIARLSASAHWRVVDHDDQRALAGQVAEELTHGFEQAVALLTGALRDGRATRLGIGDRLYPPQDGKDLGRSTRSAGSMLAASVFDSFMR